MPEQRITELIEETHCQPESDDNIPTELEGQIRRGRLHLLREVVETVVLTVVIFVAINTITGRFRVEGPSMLPNLHEGQYLIINKVLYRLDQPERGDIVVFQHPRNPGRDLIKRIIGLPGETVEIREGQVYIDGERLDEPYLEYHSRYSGYFELGLDEYFVLGDNRPNSDDSHNWGALKKDQIVGKAWISYWPPTNWGGVPHFSFSDTTEISERGLEYWTRVMRFAVAPFTLLPTLTSKP